MKISRVIQIEKFAPVVPQAPENFAIITRDRTRWPGIGKMHWCDGDARFAPAARRGKLYDRRKNEAAAGKCPL